MEQEFIAFSLIPVGSFITCTYHQLLLGSQLRENEVGRTCGVHWREERRVQGFGGKAQRKKTT
jgi:hypothetical protein